jgi:hypothetical protein
MDRRSGLRKHVRTVAIASAGAGIALASMLPWATANAAPDSVGAQLTMTGVSTSAGGGSVVRITAGDSVSFSAGPPPSRAAHIPEYAVTLNAPSFSDGSVRLSGGKTYRATFANAGSFPLSWTASDLLGTIRPRPGEYTSATVVVAAVPTTSPTSQASSTSSAPTGSTGSAPGSSVNASAAAGASIHGFAAPPSDTGSGTATASRSPGSAGASRSNGPNTPAGADSTPNPVSATTLYADIAHRTARPVGLAIVSILALAGVTGLYAYQHLGGSALRIARRR